MVQMFHPKTKHVVILSNVPFTDVTNSYIMNVITSYAMKHDFILDVIMRSLLFLLLVIVIIRGRTTVQYEKLVIKRV